MITGDYVLDGISLAISAEYPNYDIYTENIIQGFTRPCFYISQINLNHDKKLDIRYVRYQQYAITFFNNPPNNTIYREVENKLTEILEYITPLNTTTQVRNIGNIESQIIGDMDERILQVTVQYRVDIIREIQPEPLQEELEINQFIKEE